MQALRLILACHKKNSGLQADGAYKVEGQVAMGSVEKTMTLFEESSSTIKLLDGAVDIEAMVNKVSVAGIGRVVEWFGRARVGGLADEVCTVLHRGQHHTVSFLFLIKLDRTDL